MGRGVPLSVVDRDSDLAGDFGGVSGDFGAMTLVQRTTRFVMLARIPGTRAADRVAPLLARKTARALQEQHALGQARRSRGSGREHHALLRQYFPKGTDLLACKQCELDAVADEPTEAHRSL